jgi:hypothetical protein
MGIAAVAADEVSSALGLENGEADHWWVTEFATFGRLLIRWCVQTGTLSR